VSVTYGEWGGGFATGWERDVLEVSAGVSDLGKEMVSLFFLCWLGYGG
jgi:hypothetical protein